MRERQASQLLVIGTGNCKGRSFNAQLRKLSRAGLNIKRSTPNGSRLHQDYGVPGKARGGSAGPRKRRDRFTKTRLFFRCSMTSLSNKSRRNDERTITQQPTTNSVKERGSHGALRSQLSSCGLTASATNVSRERTDLIDVQGRAAGGNE